MARDEQDREDLIREATALTTRAELTVEGFTEEIVIGFRDNGAASVFIGADPVYQFNAAGEIRRGYRDGRLIKAVKGQLYSMRRERSDGEVRLLRSELSADETSQYLSTCGEQLSALLGRLESKQFELIRHVPLDVDVVTRIVDWLKSLPRPVSIAAKPNVN